MQKLAYPAKSINAIISTYYLSVRCSNNVAVRRWVILNLHRLNYGNIAIRTASRAKSRFVRIYLYPHCFRLKFYGNITQTSGINILLVKFTFCIIFRIRWWHIKICVTSRNCKKVSIKFNVEIRSYPENKSLL